MTAKNQLQLVKDQAEDKQRQLSERFQKAVEFVHSVRQQLLQLQGYESDYRNKINREQQSWTAENSNRYRHFLHQLNKAIGEQTDKLHDAEKHLDKMREQLWRQQQRIEVLEDMIRRDAFETARVEDLHLQKEMDEHANRLYSVR